MHPSWTPAEIPSQTGRRAIITGANSGIGFYAAQELARHGATVVLASRDAAKGAEAAARILAEVPNARLEAASLDLASFASIHAFAATQTKPLDLLVNNAGVMTPPKRQQTAEGMELQFGTNVAGHFALTALLFPTLTTPAPRIVTIASIAHKRATLNFADLQSTRKYSPMGAYQQSKLANLMLAFELDRRLRAAGSPILSIAAHPGVANTNLFQAHEYNPIERRMRAAASVLIGKFLNTQLEGAIPTLYAATSPAAQSGGYYGPQGFQEMRGGDVGPAKVARQARDPAAAKKLWEICENLTGLNLL